MASHTAKWTKSGAVFANGEAARDDNRSLWPAEFAQQVLDSDTQLLAQGIMTSPVVYTWDQATQTYEVVRQLSSDEEWLAAIRNHWDLSAATGYGQSAGWTWLGATIIE